MNQEQAYIEGFVKRAAEYGLTSEEALKLAGDLLIANHPEAATDKNIYSKDVAFTGLDANRIKYLIAAGKKMSDSRAKTYANIIGNRKNYNLKNTFNFEKDIINRYLQQYPEDEEKFNPVGSNYEAYLPIKGNLNAQISNWTDESKLHEYAKKELERYNRETGVLKKLFSKTPTEVSVLSKLPQEEIKNMQKTYSFGVLHDKANAKEIKEVLESSNPGITGEMYFKKVAPKK
jgi:hypothetical protein